jgi:hypothetical protein
MTIKLTSFALLVALAAACGDDAPNNPPNDGAPDDMGQTGKTFKQVEVLARPGINEALLITDAFLAGYNAAGPSFAGVDAATLGAVVGEAKTVLKALYLGVCLLDGTVTNDPAQGLKPAGMQCPAVGGGIFTENALTGVTLTQAAQDAATAYANTVFDQFVPDVMRVDTAVASNYLTPCGGTGKQLLCGGRFLNDDVIDVTYNYLISGLAIGKGAFDQLHALVQDGVVFDNANPANNSDSFIDGDPNNRQQGHPNVSQGFPYSAAPF